MKRKKRLIILVLTAVVTVGLMYSYQSYTHKPTPQPAYGAEAEWLGVRGAATWMRAANITLNTLFASVTALAPYQSFLSGTINITPTTNPGYYIRLSDNGGAGWSVEGKNYSKSLQVWYYDGSYTKAMEFFFNSFSDPKSGTGVLLIIRPFYFNQSAFYNTEMYKVRYKKDESTPTTSHMVISASNYYSGSHHSFKYGDDYNPSAIKTVLARGRLTDDGTYYSFAALARLNKSYTPTVCLPPIDGTSYYTLAFVADKAYPHYSIAKFGWDESGNIVWKLCGNPTNRFNYGFFNATPPYFVKDGEQEPQTGYPTQAQVNEVDFDMSDNELKVTKESLPTSGIEFHSPANP